MGLVPSVNRGTVDVFLESYKEMEHKLIFGHMVKVLRNVYREEDLVILLEIKPKTRAM